MREKGSTRLEAAMQRKGRISRFEVRSEGELGGSCSTREVREPPGR